MRNNEMLGLRLSIAIPPRLSLDDVIRQLEIGTKKLSFDSRLTYLFIESINKADGKAERFLTALKNTKSLTVFDASSADWDDKHLVANEIFNALKNNTSIEIIDLTGNKFSEYLIVREYVKEISTLPSHPLKLIKVSHNGFSPTSGATSTEVRAYKMLQLEVFSLKKKNESQKKAVSSSAPALLLLSSSNEPSSEHSSSPIIAITTDTSEPSINARLM